MATLQVTVRHATVLQSKDIWGKMDMYVIIKTHHGEQVTQYKTTQVKGDKQQKVEWNETLYVPIVPEDNAYIQLWVMDKDVFSSDVCGIGRINLKNCGVFERSIPIKYNVQLHNQKDKNHAGELHVTILAKAAA